MLVSPLASFHPFGFCVVLSTHCVVNNVENETKILQLSLDVGSPFYIERESVCKAQQKRKMAVITPQ